MQIPQIQGLTIYMHIYVYTFSEYNFILSIGRFSSDRHTCAVADTLTIHIHTHKYKFNNLYFKKTFHHVKSLPIVLKNFITCFSFDFQKKNITFFPKHAFKELRSSIRNSYIFLGNGTSWVLGICLQGNQYKKVISITTKHWESGIRLSQPPASAPSENVGWVQSHFRV